MRIGGFGTVSCSRRDSNPYRRYRKPKFYPLNYGSRMSLLGVQRYGIGPLKSKSIAEQLVFFTDVRGLHGDFRP